MYRLYLWGADGWELNLASYLMGELIREADHLNRTQGVRTRIL